MSSTVQVLLIDDIDGSPADETVQFALDGANYELDLSKRNALALRQMLARYIKSARRVSGGSRTAATSMKPAQRRNGKVTTAKAAGSRAGRSGAAKPATSAGSKSARSRSASARTTARTGAAAKARTQAKRRTTAKRAGQDPAQIRQWARAQGLSVSERGRIPSELISKFQDAVR